MSARCQQRDAGQPDAARAVRPPTSTPARSTPAALLPAFHGHPLQIKITRARKVYHLGEGIGSVMVLGLADTGRKADAGAGVIYDDCYQEGMSLG